MPNLNVYFPDDIDRKTAFECEFNNREGQSKFEAVKFNLNLEDIMIDNEENKLAISVDMVDKPITIPPATPIALNDSIPTTAGFVKMAIEKNLDVDRLSKLLELHERNERRLAEREFEARFADMQKDYEAVYKNKVGTKGRFKYAPLPDILEIYMPILTKHGFSVRWGEQVVPESDERITTCYLSGHGFIREASISLPIADKNDMINAIQARAITNSYGRRYSFMNVTGCIIAEEDSDGVLPEQDIIKIKQEALKNLQFIPRLMQDGLRAAINGADIMQVRILSDKIFAIKEICQSKLKKAPNNERQAVFSSLNNIRTEDELSKWVDKQISDDQSKDGVL